MGIKNSGNTVYRHYFEMNILFVDPFGDKEFKGLNLGIAYCAANLRKHGHRVSVLDLNNIRSGDSTRRLKKAVETYRPDGIGFSVMSLSYYGSIALADELRSYYKGLIIFGGCEISAQKERVFDYSENIDIAVIGEGDVALVEIAELFNRGQLDKLDEVKGIVWKKNKEVIKTPRRDLLKDLDTLPFPDYDVFGVKKLDHYSLLTSRGCPFNCSFCFQSPYLGSTWRSRNVNKCIEELKSVINKYEIRVLQICDPCFNANVERVEHFCDALMSEKIDIPWYAIGVRANKVTNRMAGIMKKSGCRRVWLGIESLHKDVFRRIGKGETIEDIKKGVGIFKDNGIQVYGYFVMGLPGDTLKRTLYSCEEALKLDLDAVSFSSAVPFTGTRLEKWISDKNARLITNPLTISCVGSKYENIAYETGDFTLRERKRARLILNIKAQAYEEHGLPRWLFYLKKIYLIIRYDCKNLIRRLGKSVKYRRNKNSNARLTEQQFISFGRIPDGTWGLSKDENLSAVGEERKIDIRALDL